jgi:hypothetical protein
MRRVDASHGAMHLILLGNLHAGRRLRQITSDELSQVRNRKNVAEGINDPAFALTISRMKAAGYEFRRQSAPRQKLTRPWTL